MCDVTKRGFALYFLSLILLVGKEAAWAGVKALACQENRG